MGRGKSKVNAVGAFTRGAQQNQLEHSQMAKLAVHLGLAIRAKKVFAVFRGDQTVTATEYGVVVIQEPHDLPFQEHPAYDAMPKVVLSGKVDNFREGAKSKELFEGIRDFMNESDALVLRVDLPDEQSIYANKEAITLYGLEARRFFPGKHKVSLRHEVL
jgi:hypothetical protein